MTSLAFAPTAPAKTAASALVIGVGERDGELVLVAGATDVDRAYGRRLVETLRTLGATGRAGELTRTGSAGTITADTLVAVGLGPLPTDGRIEPEALRRGAGTAVRSLAGLGTVAVALTRANGSEPDDTDLRAVVEGALLGAYRYGRYRSGASAASAPEPVGEVVVLGPKRRSKPAAAVLAAAQVVADGVALARDLVNTPANDLHPDDLAQAAVTAATAVGCTVEVLDDAALRDGGYGGLTGVGQGAAHPPRLVRIEWDGGRKAKRTVHLAGKGITFDSGGLSLKPPASMEWMKTDMGGAAAVLATLVSVARLKLPVNVVGWLAIAENMPSGTAIRPGDVLTIRGGTTVEVLNTDAEGRLVLADAIVRAGEESPDVIVDVATLTGAQIVALGSRVYAVMANDNDLRTQVVAAADRSGEQAWPMPLPRELRASLDSPVADMANVGERYGGMMVAGLFLAEFVPDGVPWAHLDIAGPSWNETEPHDYTPRGATGVPVRTLVEWVSGLAG
jgi:leucyl aminopeptidase